MAAEKLREGQAALEVDAITALEIAQDCSAQRLRRNIHRERVAARLSSHSQATSAYSDRIAHRDTRERQSRTNAYNCALRRMFHVLDYTQVLYDPGKQRIAILAT